MPTKKKKAPPANGNSLEKIPQEKSTEENRFPIVGIGASAGGLETLTVFFAGMPSDSNMAFVIIQHLSPPAQEHHGIAARKTDFYGRQ